MGYWEFACTLSKLVNRGSISRSDLPPDQRKLLHSPDLAPSLWHLLRRKRKDEWKAVEDASFGERVRLLYGDLQSLRMNNAAETRMEFEPVVVDLELVPLKLKQHRLSSSSKEKKSEGDSAKERLIRSREVPLPSDDEL